MDSKKETNDNTIQFQLRVIDHYCTFQYLLEYRSSDYQDLEPSNYTPNTSVYCPFHENKDTKAAKLYPKDNEKPFEKLFCFQENKLFYPHSLLTPPKDSTNPKDKYIFHSIVPYTPQWVFNAIWNNLPEKEKEYWKTIPEYIPPVQIQTPIYDLYKKGKIDLFSLLNRIEKEAEN